MLGRRVYQRACLLVLSWMFSVFFAFASEVVTRSGFVQDIDIKTRQIIVDGQTYEFSEGTKVFLEGRSVSIHRLQKGDFVILSVKKATPIILQITIQPDHLVE